MILSDIEKVTVARDELLANAQTILISVDVSDAEPQIGSSPFIRDDEGHFYIYTSDLSAHVQGLLKGANARFLIIADESKSQNIWARVRLNFTADYRIIERNSPEFEQIIPMMEDALGATMTLIKSFKDFHLIKITPTIGTLVTGFASAYNISGPSFTIGDQLRKS